MRSTLWVQPKTCVSPSDEGDHPELDTLDELKLKDIEKCQSFIASLQWTVSLGLFDITTAVMTPSGFRVAPSEGYSFRARRIVGHLVSMKEGESDFVKASSNSLRSRKAYALLVQIFE